MARFMTSGFSASNLGSQPRCLRKSPQADEHGRPNQEPLESAMTVKDLAGLWLSSEPLKRTDPRQERGVCEPESDGGPPQTRPRKAPWCEVNEAHRQEARLSAAPNDDRPDHLCQAGWAQGRLNLFLRRQA
jgi:hypothetical protein